MAGYTSRHFLSLTIIPSILGLSIIWFLKKKSSISKQTSKAPHFEDTISEFTDQHPTLYPMKIKNQEADSVEETVQAEMQLKESDSTAETQCQISNGVIPQNTKVKGKGDNMTRLCENGNSCLMEEPITNGCRKDNAALRNGDSKIEVTNGMNALCLNGVSLPKESVVNGTSSKSCEMDKIVNGLTVSTNGVGKSIENSYKSKTQATSEEKAELTASKTDVEIDKSCIQEGIELAAAKEQHQADVHMQSSSVCNGSSSEDTKSHSSSIEGTLLAEKLLTSIDHRVAVSNGLLTESDDSSLTDSSEELMNECKVTDIDDHLLVCEVANSDEHSLQLLENPVDTIEPSPSTSHSVTVDTAEHPTNSVNCNLTDNENPTLPINELTVAEQLTPPVDYVVTDSAELLTLPIDDIAAENQGEMLESPGATYCDSLGSNDSGRGASEIQFTSEDQVVYMVYEFEIYPEDCGRLIGKLGRHVKYINKQTNANIVIKKHPCSTEKKLCAVTGTETEINAALKLIRKRFPVEHYPSVTLAQINSIPISTLLCPETLKLSLPEGGVFEALLCSTVTAGHFFLQQPTHPTYYQLPPLTNAMNALYGQTETPMLDTPTKGNICAAEIGGGWYRAEIDEVYEESDNCRLKFLDYGGYADIPKTSIRKIKCDFMLIPFQATECYLAGVMPLDDNGWSAEATELFEQEAQGQLIQGCIVAYADNRIPYVNLYKITGITSVFINHKLISNGLARGITLPAVESGD